MLKSKISQTSNCCIINNIGKTTGNLLTYFLHKILVALVIKTKNFLQSIAIMKRCNVFITNYSALMHIASALGRKVVAIIGPTNKYYIHS